MFARRQVLFSVIKVQGGEGILDGMTGVCPPVDAVQCNRGLGRFGNSRGNDRCLSPDKFCLM